MTDRLSTPPAAPSPSAPITLSARGKFWGSLLDDGRFLEITRRGCVVTFDLWESARTGRAVVVRLEEEG